MRIFFVKNRNDDSKSEWLALLSTNITISEEDIGTFSLVGTGYWSYFGRIYGRFLGLAVYLFYESPDLNFWIHYGSFCFKRNEYN